MSEEDRLDKKETHDYVFKIRIKEAVCELQLALNQRDDLYKLNHSFYEIRRSPLGCVFGSIMYMSKKVAYPFVQNCKDIIVAFRNSEREEDLELVEAAKYLVASMD